MSYSHMVFDIDGTLIDSEETALRSLHRVALELTGREVPRDELYQTFGLSSADIMRFLKIEDISRGQELWHTYFQDYMDLIHVFDGIPQVLAALKERGCHIGLISSKNREEYRHDFAPLPIAPYFDTTVLADDSPTHKPQPGPMLAYLAKTGARPEEVLFIGDSVYDMVCGRSAGVDQALALWGRKEDPSIEATYRLSTPQDLLAL